MSFSSEPSGRRASAEAARLLVLRNLQLLDTDSERSFDDIVGVASTICAAPIASISLVDADRQWFKAHVGMESVQTSRDMSFCSVAIGHDVPIFEVPDTLEDDVFRDYPNVAGRPNYRFYAGVPLRVHGVAIGTLCVLDTVPRTLSADQRESLIALARGAVATIEYRHAALAITQADRQLEGSEKDAAVFAAAVAHAQDAILILGTDEATGEPRRVTYVNPAFSKLFGRDFSKSIGRSLGEVAHYSANRESIERLYQTLKNGTLEPIALRLRLAHGEVADIEITASPLPAQSVDARLIVVLRDVSARRAASDIAALERSEDRWQALFARTNAIAYTLDRELRFRSSSGGGLASIGLLSEEIAGIALADVLVEAADRDKSLAAHARALAGESVAYECEIEGRRFKMYLEPLRSERGEIEGTAGLAFDVTDYFVKSRALEETEAHVARAERTAQTGSWLHDLSTNRLTYSEESQRMFGMAGRAVDREDFYRHIVSIDRERVRTTMRTAYETGEPATLEYRIVVDGAVRFIRESIELSRDSLGQPSRADGIFIDITQRRLAELDAFRIAYTDAITGLPNRGALRSHVDREIVDPAATLSAFLSINIDRFRATNDVLGHDAGDRLLRIAGARIRSAVPNSYVARLENDVFALLLETGTDPESIAARLHAAFRARVETGDNDIDVSISIGVAPAEPGMSIRELEHRAETAMRSARVAGGDRTVTFSQETEAFRIRRLGLQRDLPRAIERDEFEIAYQPILDTSGAVVSLEALLRWNHPAFGRVPPDEFIALAEESGTIVAIGRWVLRTACHEVDAIRKRSRVPVRVAVNISARQFSDAGLQLAIHEALALAGLPPSALEVEITETTIARDARQATNVLTDLRLAGVTVSVDDFGTGYSSLANLRRFPLDNLKIDRAFVAKVPGDVEDCAIVDAVIGLARQLSLQIIAEGVETLEQAEYLVERGCAMLQGYHFAKPMNAADMTRFVAANRRAKRRRRGA